MDQKTLEQTPNFGPLRDDITYLIGRLGDFASAGLSEGVRAAADD
jgi:hypothetical protein